mgnify:CR=1 FL=1
MSNIDSLRHFIRATLEDQEKAMKNKMKTPAPHEALKVSHMPGAGIVVVRQFDDGWRILGLSLNDFLDIPKGVIEPGEKPLQTAIRETEEEAGISELKFEWGFEPVIIGQLTVYVASCDQDPVIEKNPETGIYEHQGYVWTSWDNMISNAYPYLKGPLEWARNIVEELQPANSCP